MFPVVGNPGAAIGQQPINLNGYSGGYGSIAAPTQYTDMFGRPVQPSGGQENGAGSGGAGGGQPGGGTTPGYNPLLGGTPGQYAQAEQSQARYGGMPGYNQGVLQNRVLGGNMGQYGTVGAISPLLSQMMGAFGGSASPYSGGFNTNFGMSVNPYQNTPANPQLV